MAKALMEAVSPIKRAAIDGVELYYEHYENPGRQTLVCVHGFLSSAFSFRKLIPLLRNHYDIIAVDLPPFGQSEKSRTFVYTYANLAKLLIGLLESSVSAGPHSSAIQWAARFPYPRLFSDPSFFLKSSCCAARGI